MDETRGLIRYELEDGTPLFIETAHLTAGGKHRIARGEDEAEDASERFEAAVKRIRPAAQLVLDAFRGLNEPQEIQLEFGVKFSAKAGVILASADSEATFKATLKWTRPG